MIKLEEFVNDLRIPSNMYLIDMNMPEIDVDVSSQNYHDFCRAVKELGMEKKRHVLIEQSIEQIYSIIHDRLGSILMHYSIVECVDSRYIQIGGVSLRVSVGIKRKQRWQRHPKKIVDNSLCMRISELLYIDSMSILNFTSFPIHRLQLLARQMFPSMFNLQEIWKGDQEYIASGRAQFGFNQQNCILKPFVRNILKMHDRHKYRYIFDALDNGLEHWNICNVLKFISSVNQHFFTFLSRQEKKIILEAVGHFLSLSKYELMTLDYFMPRFVECANSWFEKLVNPILARYSFIYWYFKKFLKPLLLKFFYVTDSDFYGNKVFFIPRYKWTFASSIQKELFISTNFIQVEHANSHFGSSNLRLLPKSRGLRPIVNLSRKNSNEKSINEKLKNAFTCCSMELNSRRFGQDNIYSITNLSQLEPFFQVMKLQKKPLYVVKTDFESAYDCIDQSTSISLVKSLLKHREYPIIEYFENGQSGNEWYSKQHRKAISSDNPIHLRHNMHLFPMRKSFFEPTKGVSYVMRTEILQLIRSHIHENVINIKDKNYKQKKGVPQGSILSATLCTLVFHDFLKQIMSRLDSSCHVAHFVDDVLLFSNDPEQCKLFLKYVQQPQYTHGLKLNSSKTWTATSMGVNSEITWCGLKIRLDDFGVRRDYSKYAGREIRYFTTITNINKISHIFKVHLLRMLYGDMNGDSDIIINLIQHTLLSCYKSIALVKVLVNRGHIIKILELEEILIKSTTQVLHAVKTKFIKENWTICNDLMLYIIDTVFKRNQFGIRLTWHVSSTLKRKVLEQMTEWEKQFKI
eukprot:NODE_563_length_6640_cov_0.236661.p1 type:complete len:802 gc:universal NODE_563_length_6640_cov_0.236661:5747-3342(-)